MGTGITTDKGDIVKSNRNDTLTSGRTMQGNNKLKSLAIINNYEHPSLWKPTSSSGSQYSSFGFPGVWNSPIWI
ncbi:MAG: hypothetical protein M3297_06995 [Thermoproteota archaeon]|nr:hypothetical protein [Thermoproteota archaeon]